mmetsp:Transcript_8927/g.13658  ORF Transcript_8927/g.13658 Transcript_8927/m.13658 type:complete len:252 (-) Transcript_8927:382-1137(-)
MMIPAPNSLVVPSSRDARFTLSLSTEVSMRLRNPTVPRMTSPVWMPMPTRMSPRLARAHSRLHCVRPRCMPMAALMASVAQPPNRAMMASPTYLSINPSFRAMCGPMRSRNAFTNAKVSGGVMLSLSDVNPRRSAKRIVMTRCVLSPSCTSVSVLRLRYNRNSSGTNRAADCWTLMMCSCCRMCAISTFPVTGLNRWALEPAPKLSTTRSSLRLSDNATIGNANSLNFFRMSLTHSSFPHISMSTRTRSTA